MTASYAVEKPQRLRGLHYSDYSIFSQMSHLYVRIFVLLNAQA